MSEEQIKPHRDAIDSIDEKILQLLNQRAEHASKIGQIKGCVAVYRPEREAQVLRRIKTLNQGPLASEAVTRLFREIMSECLALERPLMVAFLGPEGTFTQQAAIKQFGHAAQNIACASIDEAFRLVESRAANYVIAPVENSTGGAIGRTLDLMISTPLSICSEVVLRIHHNLLRNNQSFDAIRRIYSHGQSLAQCHEWLNQNLPDAERVSVSSNAEAARLASVESSCAAIAGRAAAERFSLKYLAQNIEDEPNNTTRFLVLGYQQVNASGNDKTSLIVSTPNRSGIVHELLAPLAENGVSMCKFESRPARAGLWEYVFFIDIEGHMNDANVAKALAQLSSRASFVKVLGSYPRAVI